MKLRNLVLYLAVAIPTTAFTLPLSYSPFFPDENYTLSLGVCSTSRNVINIHPPEGTIEFWHDKRVTLTLTMADSHYIAQVHSDSMPRSKSVHVNVQAVMPFDVLQDAICADLNRDKKMDFVVTLWHHGNGLGAEFYSRLIALSTRDEYRFWVVPTMTPSAEDFVTFGQLEPIVMVTTNWANTNGYSDPYHSYYVYDLWTFRDGSMISANQVDARFPKWVWWTMKENHKPTTSLSEGLRQRLRRHFIVGPLEATP